MMMMTAPERSGIPLLPSKLQLRPRKHRRHPIKLIAQNPPLPLGHLLLMISQHRVIEHEVMLALELLEHIQRRASVQHIGVSDARLPCYLVDAGFLAVALVQEVADDGFRPVGAVPEEAQVGEGLFGGAAVVREGWW